MVKRETDGKLTTLARAGLYINDPIIQFRTADNIVDTDPLALLVNIKTNSIILYL